MGSVFGNPNLLPLDEYNSIVNTYRQVQNNRDIYDPKYASSFEHSFMASVPITNYDIIHYEISGLKYVRLSDEQNKNLVKMRELIKNPVFRE